jgi:hypothetical protein
MTKTRHVHCHGVFISNNEQHAGATGHRRVRCAATHDAGAHNDHVKSKQLPPEAAIAVGATAMAPTALGCYDGFRFDVPWN